MSVDNSAEKKEEQPAQEGPQPVEFHAMLYPNGEWKIKCPLLANPAMCIVMKGFMDELHDTVKSILANPERFKDPNRMQPAKTGGIMNFIRNKKRF